MKKTAGGTFAALAVLLITLASTPCAAAEVAEEQAVAAALAWLQEVDASAYGESWDHAAELFRQAITREDWEKVAARVRGPLGEIVDRQLKSTTYASELPGAPDGEYVVIQYETSFENKRHAVETVTPMLDPDGVWRVSGYYIK